jgi:hypothetical protein
MYARWTAVGLANGLVGALFPFAAVGGGLLAGTTAGGAILGAVAGHAAAGMSRNDLKELEQRLDAGQAGHVVVAVPTCAPSRAGDEGAAKVQQKQLSADTAAIERDAASSREHELADQAGGRVRQPRRGRHGSRSGCGQGPRPGYVVRHLSQMQLATTRFRSSP